ncbi:MAG: histidine kinase dimerization/phospho-acceptor domain-containing protein [Verrucomicrobiota bacterium]
MMRAAYMGMPNEDRTLTPAQVEALNKQLSEMRHDVNNCLALIIAAVELIKRKPESADRMIATIAEQPQKITDMVRKFSDEFEQAFGITKD